MPEKLELEVVTPERAVLTDIVDDVVIPAAQGDMDVLPGHLPIVTMLDVGEMIIHKDNDERHFLIDRGYAEVVDDRVTVLTEACEGVDDIDIEQARRILEEAREELSELEKVSQTERVEEEMFEKHRRSLKRQRMRLAFAEDDEGS